MLEEDDVIFWVEGRLDSFTSKSIVISEASTNGI